MRNPAAIIAGVIFGVMALIHLGRLLCPFEVTIAHYHLPMWGSSIFFLVAGMLSAWLFRGRSVV